MHTLTLPDVSDTRDFVYQPQSQSTRLRHVIKGLPTPYDQGSIGSCVSNSIALVWDFYYYKHRNKFFEPSRLFNYFYARAVRGNARDNGCSLRDAIKCAKKIGFVPESQWSYETENLFLEPFGYSSRVLLPFRYERVQNNISHIKASVAEGVPVLAGIVIYKKSFGSRRFNRTGVVIGYNDVTERFLVRNHDGAGWGAEHLKGDFWMPYEFAANPNLVFDLWRVVNASI
jgi:C1A family cysteine protease